MAEPQRFVLDCSVALSWYFADEANRYADDVAALFPNAEAVVPALWHLEIANALVMGERRKRSTVAQATTWLTFLSSLPIVLDGETVARAWAQALSLARTYDLTTYDAAYLEVALRLNLPLATLDSKLKAACAAAGVAIFRPQTKSPAGGTPPAT
ncbi:MAG TPA: type II toxin-antitoxin system VapC family toxin [Gemmataceae bacterium]|nr:type II toxin-antitoxin system VapC family toxin [Gemmataceae bacterium]